jgi:SAM-dependent methyltransferase
MIEIRHDNMDTTAATQEAYNKIYRKEGILLRDSFYLWLISLLHAQPRQLLLDISCGQGRLVRFAQQQGLRAIGMDFAFEAVNKGRACSLESGWTVADGERLPLSDVCIDYVTHIGSLEHYQNPDAGIREIARVLKPSGSAIVLLPNTFGLLGNIKYVWQTGEVFDDGQPLQRYNTRYGWHHMLVKNGLTPFCILKYEREWPRTRADLTWYLVRPSKIVRLFAAFFIPLNLANFLVYICHRGKDA